MITENEVLAALRAFADDSRKQKTFIPLQNLLFDLTIFRTHRRTAESGKDRDPTFWQRLVDVTPPNHDHDWKLLLNALEQYHKVCRLRSTTCSDLLSKVLSDRATAINTVENVRRENTELKMLLQQYLGSKVLLLSLYSSKVNRFWQTTP